MRIRNYSLLAILPFALCALDKAAPSDNNLLDTHVHVDDYYKPEELEQLKTLTDRTLRKKIQARAHARLYKAALEEKIKAKGPERWNLFLSELQTEKKCVRIQDHYEPSELEQLASLTDSPSDKDLKRRIQHRTSIRAVEVRKRIELDLLRYHADVHVVGNDLLNDYYEQEELEQFETLTNRTLRRKIQNRAYSRRYRARGKIELHHHIDDNELPDVQAPTVDNNLLDTHVHVDDYYKPEELEQLKARAGARFYRARKRSEQIQQALIYPDIESVKRGMMAVQTQKRR